MTMTIAAMPELQLYNDHHEIDTSSSLSSPREEELLQFILEENRSHHVVIWSKSYCSFARATRQLFKTEFPDVFVAVHQLDLHSDGSKIQALLLQLTNQSTVPNVFVHNQHVGGNSDVQAAFRDGRLTALLASAWEEHPQHVGAGGLDDSCSVNTSTTLRSSANSDVTTPLYSMHSSTASVRYDVNDDDEEPASTGTGTDRSGESESFRLMRKQLEEKIRKHQVIVWTKAYCPFGQASKSRLRQLERFGEVKDMVFIDLTKLADGDLIQQTLHRMTGQWTVPQIFINGKHVGGNSDLQEAHESGKLSQLLARK